MALATIEIPPTSQDDFWVWAQAHALHHIDCIRVAGAQFNKYFDQYILDPFDPNNMADWLQQHQQMHLAMNNLLSVSPYDLLELDWQDQDSVQTWFEQNFAEHQQWATTLNLG